MVKLRNLNEYHNWINKNVTDKGLIAEEGITSQALIREFPEFRRKKVSKQEARFYADQIVNKYRKKYWK